MSLRTSILSSHEMFVKLEKENTVLKEENAVLKAENNDLKAENAELKARLAQNSTNSSRPPSSDGLQKKPAMPRKKGGKRGGQKGHKGKTLEQSKSPDKIVNLSPVECGCGQDLSSEEKTDIECRQLFDLPEPKLEVIEYRKQGCTCPKCGAHNVGIFPDHIRSRVQYGNGVRAFVSLLNVYYKVPYKKISQLFADLYGYGINESTIVSAVKRCYEQLQSSEQVIGEKLLASKLAHFDETGIRCEGKLHWLHVCCTAMFTYLFVHAKRGGKALADSMSIFSDFQGWVVHDCWTSYFSFSKKKYALCNAHIIRELVALDEQGNPWACWFKDFLLGLLEMTKQGNNVLEQTQQKQVVTLFDNLWQHADRIEPPPKKIPGKKGKPKATKGRNLLIRLRKHKHAILAFAFQQHVPFTNNQAERDLRPAKSKIKVAGCFRTFQGAQSHARIQAFISTTRKHQLNVFQQLKNAFFGHTFLTKE